MKKINFSAGPSILPQVVFEQLSEAVLNYNNMGVSILEISHRSKAFDDIIERAFALVRELYSLTDDYEVLFLTGGASMQFCQVPYNLLPENELAAYLDTGKWSIKAIQEAKLFGKTQVVATSKDKNYTYVPKNYELDPKSIYFHITTNNTIYGTQIHDIPDVHCPLIADMSSDIFSKPLENLSKYGIIYAGAQKNTGPAGTTLVIIRKDMLGKVKRAIPTMLNYQTHIDKRSLFNTPPVYAIYGCLLTLEWAKAQGLKTLEQRNQEKASTLYKEIDRNGLFEGVVAEADRSIMNVTFVGKNTDLDDKFLAMTETANCVAIKGHRSVGGFRASLYNAMDLAGVQTLVEVMQEFERKFG